MDLLALTINISRPVLRPKQIGIVLSGVMISRKHEKVDDDYRKHILEILVGSAS
jgi:hypothetical protein